MRYLTRARRNLLRTDIFRSRYGAILLAYLVFHTAQFFSIPLFPLVWVTDLHLSDSVISLGNALFYASMLLGSLPLGRLSALVGHRRLLVAGSILLSLYPLLLGLATSNALFLVASAAGGGAWAVLNGALLNHLMDRTPKDDMPAHMAAYNVILNLGILAGSLAGPAVSARLGLHPTLFVGAGFRLLGAALFAILA